METSPDIGGGTVSNGFEQARRRDSPQVDMHLIASLQTRVAVYHRVPEVGVRMSPLPDIINK